MSLLADLISEEKINPQIAAEKKIKSQPRPGQPLIIHPCPGCSSPVFWTSVYRDGVIRCSECERPSARGLVFRWLLIVPRTRPASEADPASEFQYECLMPDFTPIDGAQGQHAPAGRNSGPGRRDTLTRPILTQAEFHRLYPRFPCELDRDRGHATTTATDHLAEASCTRCSGREFRDTEIHGGRSTRRDCTRCKLTQGFPRWAGSDHTLHLAERLPSSLEDLF